jgi:hypothetical protein
MKKAYANSLNQSAENVSQALVVTVVVDRQVASYARGVLPTVMKRNTTGASLPALKLESLQMG